MCCCLPRAWEAIMSSSSGELLLRASPGPLQSGFWCTPGSPMPHSQWRWRGQGAGASQASGSLPSLFSSPLALHSKVDSHVAHLMQGLAHCGPLLPVFIHKVLLEHSHPGTYVLSVTTFAQQWWQSWETQLYGLQTLKCLLSGSLQKKLLIIDIGEELLCHVSEYLARGLLRWIDTLLIMLQWIALNNWKAFNYHSFSFNNFKAFQNWSQSRIWWHHRKSNTDASPCMDSSDYWSPKTIGWSWLVFRSHVVGKICTFKYRVTIRAVRGSHYDSYGIAVVHRGDGNSHLELNDF